MKVMMTIRMWNANKSESIWTFLNDFSVGKGGRGEGYLKTY